MKRKLSRTGVRLAAFFHYIGVPCTLLGLITAPQLLLAAIVLLGIATVLQLWYQRCPHCGTFFRGTFWSEKDAGYCRSCGERLTFED